MLQSIVIVLPKYSPGVFRNITSNRLFSTNQINYLNQKWRQQRGLPLNPNASGVLTDGADYTYIDGRPTPYSVKQKIRIIKQQEIAEKVIRLSAEIDFAVNRHNQMLKEESEQRQRIIDSKLKPKGVELLKARKTKQ